MSTGDHENVGLLEATVSALDSLPILARLEFVKNLIFDRGGDKHCHSKDLVLVAAATVLDGVITVLKKHPDSAGLRLEP